MSQAANIVVYDATPAAHTLVPISESQDPKTGRREVLYREQLSSVPLEAQVFATVASETLKSGIMKVEVRVGVPVMESVSGQNSAGYTAAPRVAYIDTVSCVGYFHKRSTSAGRQHARQVAANILHGHTTTQAVVTTGPAAELFDQIVLPN